MRLLLAVDPGMKGALAWLDENGNLLRVEDMPVVNKQVSPALLWELFKSMHPTAVVIEYQQAMPTKLRGREQGAASTFKTGSNYGLLLMAAAALEVPWTTRRPTDWKRRIGLSKDKEQSRAMALNQWPGMAERFKFKVHEGRAEAALLGLATLHEQALSLGLPRQEAKPKPKKRIVRVP